MCRRTLVPLLAAVAVMSAAVAPAQDPATARKVALLVGVNHYDKRGFAGRPLQYAERDMTELADELTRHGFEVRVLLGSNTGGDRATRAAFDAALKAVLTGVNDADTVLLAFAGHGEQLPLKNEDGSTRRDGFTGEALEEVYYAPADAVQGEVDSLIGLTGLMDRVDRRGGINLILVDACRDDPSPGRSRSISGNTLNGRLPVNTALLFACSAGQEALETPKAGGGHGVFFHHVIEGLRGDAADPVSQQISWNSLVGYAQRSVNRKAAEWFPARAAAAVRGRVQTPQLLTNLVDFPQLAGLTVTVAADGTGEYRSIQAAIDAVPAGSRIRVMPGTYREGLVIVKPLTLEGVGGRERVIVEADDADTLWLKAATATVRGLTLRRTTGSTGKKSGVFISVGRPLLEDCATTSAELHGIEVVGVDTAPTVRGCTAENAKQCGLFILLGAGGDYYNCTFTGNEMAQIAVQDAGTSPIVRRCNAADGEGNGLSVHNGAGGTYEDCTFNRSRGAGMIVVGAGTSPTIRGCTAADGKGNGLVILGGSGGTYQDCTFTGNGAPGIVARDAGTSPTVRGCTAADGEQGGLIVFGGASGIYEKCTFTDNKLTDIEVWDAGTAPIVRGCTASDGKSGGLSVFGGAGGSYEGCTFTGKTHAGIAVWDAGSNPTVRKCEAADGENSGLFVHGGAGGTYEDCTFTGNKLSGIAVDGTGTSPTFRGCTSADGKDVGLDIRNGAAGTYEDCTFSGNALAGIIVRNPGSAPTVSGGESTGNDQSGVYVREGARPKVTGVDLRGNKQGAWLIDASSFVTRSNNIE